MKILGKWAETICIFSRMAVAGRRSSLLTNLKIYPFAVVTRLMVLSRRETYTFQTLKTIKSVLLDLPIFSTSLALSRSKQESKEPRQFWILLFSWVSWPELKVVTGLVDLLRLPTLWEQSKRCAMNILPFIIGPSTVE